MDDIRFGKGGDGKSTLSSQFKISKSDPRFSAIGALEELSAEAYLCVTAEGGEIFADELKEILPVIEKISKGAAAPRSAGFFVTDNEIMRLNELIAALSRFNEASEKPLNELAAKFNKAKAVARRAERELVAADLKFGSPKGAIGYLNVLSKLFAAEVKKANSLNGNSFTRVQTNTSAAVSAVVNPISNPIDNSKDNPTGNPTVSTEKIIESVVKRMIGSAITLEEAKVLTEKIEKEAERRGKKAVIAICNEQGNPVSVHVMDGAFLVSFNVAVKKAYTAAALKMSTIELSSLVKPGETFYGLQSDEKLMIIGGGVPLKRNGKVVGGLGISGGTGEEDHSLCEYALSIFDC